MSSQSIAAKKSVSDQSPSVSDTNWFNELTYWTADDFESRLNPFISTTAVVSDRVGCDCNKPMTLTDTLIGSLESFFGKEAKDDEIIGAESLPTTYQGPGVRWRPKWFPDGAWRNLVDANLSWADLRDADLKRADLRDADLREADLRRADLTNAYLIGADLTGAINLDTTQNLDFAFWNRTTCPDGSMNFSNVRCFGDQLIPG